MAWYGTFLTKHRTLPPPPQRPRRECDHSIPRIRLDGLVCLPFRPTITIGVAPSKLKPRAFHAGHRLGWDRPPLPPAPCATNLPRTSWRLPPPRAIHGHHRLILRPKTFVGSISAHESAADSLASSGNGAVDTGAPPGSAFRPPFVLSIAHHWRLRFSPS